MLGCLSVGRAPGPQAVLRRVCDGFQRFPLEGGDESFLAVRERGDRSVWAWTARVDELPGADDQGLQRRSAAIGRALIRTTGLVLELPEHEPERFLRQVHDVFEHESRRPRRLALLRPPALSRGGAWLREALAETAEDFQDQVEAWRWAARGPDDDDGVRVGPELLDPERVGLVPVGRLDHGAVLAGLDAALRDAPLRFRRPWLPVAGRLGVRAAASGDDEVAVIPANWRTYSPARIGPHTPRRAYELPRAVAVVVGDVIHIGERQLARLLDEAWAGEVQVVGLVLDGPADEALLSCLRARFPHAPTLSVGPGFPRAFLAAALGAIRPNLL